MKLIRINVELQDFFLSFIMPSIEEHGFPLGFEMEWARMDRYYWSDKLIIKIGEHEFDH
jgi:hypothetical protein